MTIISCSSKQTDDWRQIYFDQEKKRIVTITKYFEYSSGDYILKSTDSAFETFNEKGQKLGMNDRHFYKYDTSGKLIFEEYCMRTCERPGKEIYHYDSLNRLNKTVVVVSKGNEWVSAQYYYNDNSLLIKKVIGNDSIPTSETYTYDSLSRTASVTTREYNRNIDKWLTFVDSMFYGSNNNMILKKKYSDGEDLLRISKYSYQDTLLISQVDTAITTNKIYLLTPEATHHAYYFRTDYKYNSDHKVIEKVTTQSDYKTPTLKVTYEYR